MGFDQFPLGIAEFPSSSHACFCPLSYAQKIAKWVQLHLCLLALVQLGKGSGSGSQFVDSPSTSLKAYYSAEPHCAGAAGG